MEWESLPEGCIATLLAHTTPLDTCRLSLVSKTFYSAGQSDAVWTTFLPDNYSSIISRSDSGSSLLASSSSLKSLYLTLSDHPILIDNGTKSLQLERKSGKMCYMLAARVLLDIAFGDTPYKYLKWKSLTESRFPEVAELSDVCRLEIHGVICSNALSPNTCYAAYLVFKIIHSGSGFEYDPVELSVDLSGVKQFEGWQNPNVRNDGWLEVMIGEFFNSGLEDEKVQINLLEAEGGPREYGLIIEGIEFRSMEGN